MVSSTTPEEVLQFNKITEGFLCPLSANVYGIEFGSFGIRDLDSGVVLFEVKRDPLSVEVEEIEDEDQIRTIHYHFGPDFLKLQSVGTTLEFAVGENPVTNFRMIERHYFREKLLKSYDFNIEFCIPNTVNTWEALYELPPIPEEQQLEMIASPWETASDSFYFVEGVLMMHHRAFYNFSPLTNEEES